MANTASTYAKYFLSVVFEAVTMALAIMLCNAFISAGLPSFTGSYSDWAKTLIYVYIIKKPQIMTMTLNSAASISMISPSPKPKSLIICACVLLSSVSKKKQQQGRAGTLPFPGKERGED